MVLHRKIFAAALLVCCCHCSSASLRRKSKSENTRRKSSIFNKFSIRNREPLEAEIDTLPVTKLKRQDAEDKSLSREEPTLTLVSATDNNPRISPGQAADGLFFSQMLKKSKEFGAEFKREDVVEISKLEGPCESASCNKRLLSLLKELETKGNEKVSSPLGVELVRCVELQAIEILLNKFGKNENLELKAELGVINKWAKEERTLWTMASYVQDISEIDKEDILKCSYDGDSYSALPQATQLLNGDDFDVGFTSEGTRWKKLADMMKKTLEIRKALKFFGAGVLPLTKTNVERNRER